MDRLPNKGSAQQAMWQMNTQLMGRTNYLNDRLEGRSNHRPEGLAEEEWCPFLTPGHLSNRSTRFGLQPASGQPLRPEGLARALFPTPTRVSDWDAPKPLLTALLQLAHSEPTETNLAGTPAR